MSVTIPLRSDVLFYSESVVLDGATYILEFAFNARSAQWLMSISDSAGNPLATGVRVVVDFPLARRLQDARLPPGLLQAFDTGGAHRDPLQNDLGGRVVLVYYSKAEVAARLHP